MNPGATPWGGRIEYRARTGSTMDDALALEQGGAPDGSLVWAGFQTAGRGRHPGRTWTAEPGASLLFTIYWSPTRFRVPTFAPSLTVGLGLALWLEGLGIDPVRLGLKWPNDLYLDGRKTAGILVRRLVGSRGAGTVHAGIGVNLRPPTDTGFRTPAAAVTDAGLELSPQEALATLLPALAVALDHPDPRSACEARLWRRGAELELSLPDGETRRGVVRGLDAEGRLLWDAPAPEAVSSGE